MSTEHKFKFPMHDTHLKKSIKNVKVACALAFSSAVLLFFTWNLPHRNAYKQFYSTYDPIESFERMADGGYLSSVPPCPQRQKEKKEAAKKRKDEAKKQLQKKTDDKKKK